ncbi:MAG: hypothetical protein H0U39_03745 [Segetibacter sp.]|nr:hypothetical protein [Segetibacter sp.]
MKKTLLFIVFIGVAHVTFSQKVRLLYDKTLSQAIYAAKMLEKTLLERGYLLKEAQASYEISLLVNAGKLKREAYSILQKGEKITINGGDERGLIYGSLSLAEDLKNGIPLQKIKSRSESPHLPFRAIKFNLPWDSYRHSQALDLHTETCRDLNFWAAFLDMMTENRFNALTLWNLHPFTFMIRPKNFPEASPFSDKEMAEWKIFYQGLFRMAKERSIDTYIVNWNIYVTPEFSKAHNVAMDNLDHKLHSTGDTSEIIKRYTRESITQVLEEYPDLSGIGFTHGESMWGMTPQQRQDWFKETIIEGMRLANRKSKLIHRVPLSANLALGGSTSVDTEELTRKAMEELDFLDGPVWAEIKFNWSHAYSSPKLIKVHGGKLNDTYFKPEPKNYKIAWMARNEDFFCLRWGVPDFIRKHIAANTQSYVGGYFVGSECYIPAKDYFTKTGTSVNWKYAFERQWLFYKQWGRLLYNSATPDDVFKAEFIRRYGKQADVLLDAYAHAGTTPLRLASSFNFTWDFTLYSEGFMALDNKSMDYISVDRQINQPAADPDYVSVSDYVNTLSSGGSFANGKITPPILARMLEQDCKKALDLVKNIKTANNNTLMYEVADVKAWANLGLSFAQKLKGAVALQTYRLKGGEENKQNAVRHLEEALRFWDVVVGITRPIYNDMPLTHYSEQNDKLRFHWEILRPEVAKDLEIAKNTTFNLGK